MANEIYYQWQVSKDGGSTYTNLAEATGSYLHISGINETYNNNLYRCGLTRRKKTTNTIHGTPIDISHYKYSDAAKLKVLPEIEYSTNEDQTYDITNGSLSINPSSIIDSGSIVNYQWQYSDDNGETFYNISNENSASLNISGLTISNNNYIYRRQTSSYYGSGNIAVSYSPTTKALYQNQRPLLKITSQPKDYYGVSGSASFSVEVGSGNILGSGNYDPLSVKYCWQTSIDNGNSWINIDASTPTLVVDDIDKKQFNKYRCNVSYDQSIHGISGSYTLISYPASIITYKNLINQINKSEIFGLNHYLFKSINGNLGILSNNTSGTIGEMTLFSIDYGSTKKELTANYAQTVSNSYGNIAIKSISLYEINSLGNKVLIKTTDTSQISDKPKSDLAVDANGNITSNGGCIAVAGNRYGNGYVININNTINHRSLDNPNYKQLVFNCLVKASQVKSDIRVGVISSGRPDYDLQIINKLQTIKSSSKVNFFVLQDSNISSVNDLKESVDVILLLNSYNWSSYTMSNTNQENIRLWIDEHAGALVTGEWVLWNSAARRKFSILKETFPIIPTSRYSSRSILRWYQYNTQEDPILNKDVSQDFEFVDTGVAGVETLAKNIRQGAEIFYISEQIHKSSSASSISSNELVQNFNLDDVFVLDTTIKYNSAISYGNSKYIEGLFGFDPTKLAPNTKVGGLLYWSYKSLVDSYSDQCLSADQSPNYLWGSNSVGQYADGFNSVLSKYGHQTSNFNTNLESESETISPDFISKYIKLMNGLTPCSSSSPSNAIYILNRKPTYPTVQLGENTNTEISVDVASTDTNKIQHKWYYQPANSNTFYDINIDNNSAYYLVNNISGALTNSKYKVESFINSSNKTESIFEIKEDIGIKLSLYNPTGRYFCNDCAGPSRTIYGTPLFTLISQFSLGGLSGKTFTLQGSNDNINFSDILTRSTGNTYITLSKNEVRKYMRLKLIHNNISYYSNTITWFMDFNNRHVGIAQSGNQLSAKINNNLRNDTSISNWEYSFDDQNYYSYPGIVSGDHNQILNITSNNYHKAYFRTKYQKNNNNSTYFSNSIRFESADLLDYNRIYLSQTTNNQYVINNKEYVDITINLENYSGININTIEWYKYNAFTNQYDIISNITGTSISATGISTSHANDISYKAIINNTGIAYL